MLDDTQTNFLIPESYQHQIMLQCKSRSLQKPTTIKWFRRKDENHAEDSFLENYRSIKYFENFYEPLNSDNSIKELSDNVYHSKLLVTEPILSSAVYVCVAINYSGFSYKELFIDLNENQPEVDDAIVFPEKNSLNVLFLIPLVLLLPISIIFCFILYLMINRQILKRNKSPETIFL
jgi:hypothetical protein